MDKTERFLKEIAKNTAEIAKELKKMNRDKPEFTIHPNTEEENGETVESLLNKGYRVIYEETLLSDDQGEETGYVYKFKE